MTYGANAVMQFAIPGIYPPDGSGPSDDWETDLKLPGSGQMQWIQKAVTDRGHTTRVPAQNIIVGEAGANDKRVTAIRDKAGSWIMVYTPTATVFEVDTSVLRSCEVEASWYNPLSGRYSKLAYTQCDASSKAKAFTPPQESGHTDWVLVLEAE